MGKDELKELIAQALNIPVTDIPDDASTESLPGWDSLGHLNIILTIESATGHRFLTSEIPELTSLDKLEQALR